MRNERNGDHFESLFEYSPVSLWEEDYSAIKTFFDSLRSDGVTDLARYFDEHPQEIENNMRRIEVLNINRATLNMFGVIAICLGFAATIIWLVPKPKGPIDTSGAH